MNKDEREAFVMKNADLISEGLANLTNEGAMSVIDGISITKLLDRCINKWIEEGE